MMANAPFVGGGPSLLEDLKGHDNGMQQLNSGFSSLSFSPRMPPGMMQQPDLPISSLPANAISPMPQSMDGSLRGSLGSVGEQEGSLYNNIPPSPLSPVFRQSNQPLMMTRAQSLGENSQGSAPGLHTFAASPVIHSKGTFSPSLNTSASMEGRPSQLLAGNANQQDSLASFLPPPPNLDATADASHQIGRIDSNTGLFLTENEDPPQSPFVSTPKNLGNVFNDAGLNQGMNRERSLSSPGTFLQQPAFGAKSLPPAHQVLHEDKPASWNEGPGFPAPRFREEAPMPTSSPSNYDRFRARPPRHCATRDAQALLSPRIEMRHAASEGSFNFQTPGLPLGSHAIPIGRSQPNIASGVIGVPSFDASAQGGPSNERHPFGSVDALNSHPNLLQYQPPHSSPMPIPPASPMPPAPAMAPHLQQENGFVHQPPMIPHFQRHNSTGSQHYLVNERGEVVGHASPIVTNAVIEGFPQGDPRNINFPPARPQRANSYGGPHPGHLNPIQLPLQGPPLGFNPIPVQNDALNRSLQPNPLEGSMGSIGDGRMVQHQRNNTEPIPLTTFVHQSPVGSVHSRHSGSQGSEGVLLVGEHIAGIDGPNEESAGGLEVPEKDSPASISYASKLMMPRPESIVDPAKDRATVHPLTAGGSLAKSRSRQVYNVKFKRSQRNFVLGERITREIKIGCYVKVEADRGEDLGIVMSIIPLEKYLASNRHRSLTEDSLCSIEHHSSSLSANIGDMKRIMRVATHDEISLLDVKREEEEELLRICCTKVRQRGLPMTVVDAEYQYDRNKLTFFFQAEGRIDFRELVRDLFSMYKTRIWMQQLDKNGAVDDADCSQ